MTRHQAHQANLRMAKHIYIYSPSGAVRDKAAFNRGIRLLKKQGHEVEVDPAALTSHQRFAGDDAPAWPPSTVQPPAVPTWP